MSELTPERRAVAEVLHGHERRPGRLDQQLRRRLVGLDSRAAGRAWSVTYGVLRNRSLLLARLAPLLRKPFAAQEPGARTALLVGACEILLMDSVPDRAAVDQAAEIARVLGAQKSVGFVNATLRRLASDPPDITIPRRGRDPLGWAQIATSHPQWLLGHMAGRVGPKEAAVWAAAANEEPPLVIRAKADTGAAALGEPGFLPGTRRITERPAGGPTGLPGWAEGEMWVQDEGAQAAGLLVGAKPGMRVLDACAAPGGKSFLLADAVGPDGIVDAVDLNPKRLADLSAARDRLGFSQVQVHERHWIRERFGDRPKDEPYDAVLLDAPCSGLGVIRRHPDIRWARVERDLPGFAARQLKLLESLAPAVKPGGAMVYAVCTFAPVETHKAIAAFLKTKVAQDHGYRVVSAKPFLTGLPDDAFDGYALRMYPHRHNADGFYAVRLERAEA